MKRKITAKQWTPKYRIGLTGRRVRHKNSIATIINTQMHPGSVMLDRPICGFLYWNLDELTFVKKTKKK